MTRHKQNQSKGKKVIQTTESTSEAKDGESLTNHSEEEEEDLDVDLMKILREIKEFRQDNK